MKASTLQMVVGVLGLLAAVCIVGIVVLAAAGHEIPDVLEDVPKFAVGGIVGLLVPTKSSASEAGE